MESIIVQAIVSAINSGATEVGKSLIKDSYLKFKSEIINNKKISSILKKIEKNPNSIENQTELSQELKKTQAEDLLLIKKSIEDLSASIQKNKNLINTNKTYNDRSVDMSGSVFHGNINFKNN